MGNNITEVRLLNVPLTKDYKHTIYFASASEQQSYFAGRTVKSYADFTYQRKDNIIRLPEQFDAVLKCNYVMYRNPAYSNKWFYAFITDCKYISDGRTDITIETDAIQTWLFDYTVKRSFVEREHVTDDTIGAHTIHEGLEIGEYITNGKVKDLDLKPAKALVFGSTIVPSDLVKLIGGVYNGVYSGVRYYAYPIGGSEENENYYTQMVSNMIQSITDEFNDGAISSLFLAPEFLIPGWESGGVVEESETVSNYVFNVPKKYGLQDYQAKNNKLYTYPYCYLLVSNGNGGVAQYHYEYFPESECKFDVFGVLTPGCSVRLIPNEYKGVKYPESEGLNLGKYPQCNWATDQYTNWLTQNGINIAVGLGSGVASIVQGAATGATVGSAIPGAGTVVGGAVGALSGFAQIAGTLNEVNKAQMVPPQTQGNINCGDVVTARGDNTFTYYHMSIKKEFAEIVDNYFSAYGYKINRVKVPAKNHRQNYWFTKTIDANIYGNIPQEDLQTIKNCYNTGITFWKDAANIGDYSVSNNII